MTVNPARQAYDLILNTGSASPIGLMIDRGELDPPQPGQGTPNHPAHLLSKFGPQNDEQAGIIRDVPVTMDDFSGGALVSQRFDQVPNSYAWGEGMCMRYPRVAIPAGELTNVVDLGTSAGAVTDSFEYLGDLWWVTNNGRIYKSAGGTGTPTLAVNLGGSFPLHSATVFNGSVYVGGGSGTGGVQDIQRLTGPSWFTLAGITRRHMTTVYNVTADNVGANRIWATDGPSSIRYCSGDPAVAGNWSASIAIGDSTTVVNKLPSSARHVWVIKADGVHDLDELGYSPNLTPYWAQTPEVSTTTAAMVHDRYLYIGRGTRGLERIDLSKGGERRDVPEWCSPGTGMPNETPIYGESTALCYDQGWIATTIFNANNGTSYLMYGIDRDRVNIDGPGPLLWHGAEAVLPGSAGAPIYATNIRVKSLAGSSPLMWLACNSGATPSTVMYKLDLPRTGSPLAEMLNGGSHRFRQDAKLYMTSQDWGQQYSMLTKHVWGYDARADNITLNTCDIDINANDFGGTYNFEGTITLSPLQKLGVPDNVPITTTGHSIGVRLDFTNPATSVPIFRGIRIRAGVLADQDEYTPYTVVFGEGIQLRNGSLDKRDAWRVRDQLIALQDSGPFQARNQHGQTNYVRMAQGITFEEFEADIYGKWRMRAQFLLRVMA